MRIFIVTADITINAQFYNRSKAHKLEVWYVSAFRGRA